MNVWTEKKISELELEDKLEMIETFANSLAEFYIAIHNKNHKLAEHISRVLIETFSIIIMGDDVVELENKISEIERNLNDQFKALA